MIQYETYRKALEIVRKYKVQLDEQRKELKSVPVLTSLDISINELHHSDIISARAANAIAIYIHYEIHGENSIFREVRDLKVSEFKDVVFHLKKILEYRNMGKKTVAEIKEFLLLNGIAWK